LICKPRLVISQHTCVECDILWAQVWLLVWLRVDPTKWLEIPQVVMIGELLWQGNAIV
jgi:hypothetical protein